MKECAYSEFKKITSFKRVLILLAAALAAFAPAWAYDFEVGEIYYNYGDDGEVEVTYGSSTTNSYSGDIVIPATVEYSETTYSVTAIGKHAFYICQSLTSISIPESVTSIGEDAIIQNSSLISITVSSSNECYCSDNGVLFSKDMTQLICYPSAKEGESYDIPESVTDIWEYAFHDCTSLVSVTIPEGVVSIGANAFQKCETLTEAVIPEGITSISNFAFDQCATLVSVTIPSSVTSIGEYAFGTCYALEDVTIPYGVTSIGEGAFEECVSLPSIVIPESVTYIGPSAFASMSSLVSVIIPNSVTTIGGAVFNGCESLVSVTIGSEVTSIGEGAFNYCEALSEIICLGSTPAIIESDPFEDVDTENCVLYVPIGCATAYSEADYWSELNVKDGVITSSAADVEANSATLNGRIIAGATEISDQGFEYSTSEEMTDAVSVTASADDEGYLSLTVSGLDSETEYFFRTYAEADGTTYYGDILSFTTASAPVTPPTVSTIDAQTYGENNTSVALTGKVEAGSEEIEEQGFLLSKNEDMTDAETVPGELDAEGNITADKSGLDSNETYYYKAYATTASDTYYGTTLNFKTGSTTGVSAIESQAAEKAEVARYDITGKQLSAPQQGVNIVVFSDGTAEKIMEK